MIRDLPARAARLLACVAAFSFGAIAEAQENEIPPPSSHEAVEPPPAPSESVARPAPDFGPTTADATTEAARRYAAIAAERGWPRIAKPVTPDSTGEAVLALRKRLRMEGYLAPEDEGGDVWDEALSDALRRFEANLGLEQTGEATGKTLRELNIPAATRARQLAATVARLSKTRFGFGARYVAVNIPATSVEAVENDGVAGRYTAIVGGRRNPSPRIVSEIVAIDINPAWTVPASIIRKELAPKLRRKPHYFERENIRILDGRGREIDPRKLRGVSARRAAAFTFRQDPGPGNALGSIRISMPNKQAVFMHDTPRKDLFDKDFRFLSHGCVRVEGVYDLAAWLLQETGEWDALALKDEVERGESRKIELRHPTPVAWVYMTGWAIDDGPAHFRHDVYKLDKGTRLPAPSAGVASR